MKRIVFTLLSLGLLAAQMSDANAAACAAGPYRAGCVGPHGGAVVRRPAAVVVHPHCYMRAGVRVCR
jgi:hypothetical protein